MLKTIGESLFEAIILNVRDEELLSKSKMDGVSLREMPHNLCERVGR